MNSHIQPSQNTPTSQWPNISLIVLMVTVWIAAACTSLYYITQYSAAKQDLQLIEKQIELAQEELNQASTELEQESQSLQ